MLKVLNPKNQVILSESQQWNQLDAYLNENPCLKINRGQYAERNAARIPRNHQLNLWLSSYLIFENQDNQINFIWDIFNFGKLLNRNWSKKHFVPNVQNSGFGLIDFVGTEG